jgi:hypothetical protein
LTAALNMVGFRHILTHESDDTWSATLTPDQYEELKKEPQRKATVELESGETIEFTITITRVQPLPADTHK